MSGGILGGTRAPPVPPMSRVFIVDDHAIIREGLRVLLESEGHEVVGEADAPTPAVVGIGDTRPDVVLLDLNLGERSGFELLGELARRRNDVPVIMLSMSTQPRHVAEALRLGARGYVLKGSASTELLAAIEAVTAGRRYLGKDESDLAVRGMSEPADGQASDLSPRERQILVMVCRGATSAAIAEVLHLSPKTVETYRSRLMTKLGLSDVPALVRWAIREGMIDLSER
jgi:two-component system, NarL family, invasion response regulator UvrY